MWSPPGSYYLSKFGQETAEVHELESLVRHHTTPSGSIHDIAESLTSDIFLNFPAAVQIRIQFLPNIRTSFRLDDAVAASCDYYKILRLEPSSKYEIKTEWYLRILPTSNFAIVLRMVSREHAASTVHNQMRRLETPSPRPSLGQVHPTFGLHEDVFRIAQKHQYHSLEEAAVLLAQSMFCLADKQSPCKRMQSVAVSMIEVLPVTNASQPKFQQLANMQNKAKGNKVYQTCQIHLSRDQYEQSQRKLISDGVQDGRHRVFLALGSNLGNRVEMIESAVREMGDRGLTVHRTSALYETKPMYLENQNSFLNGVCEVRCSHVRCLEDDFDTARLKHR